MDTRVGEELIFRYLHGGCNERERSLVEGWIAESPENRREFETIRDVVRGSALMKGIGAVDKDAAWERIREGRTRRTAVKKPFPWPVMRSVAAGLILFCLGVGGYLALREQASASISKLDAGDNRITLTLSDGSVVDLSGAGAALLSDAGHRITLSEDGSAINYEGSKERQETAVNRVTVPRGCRYAVSLSDGSRVWLNSDSALEYPVAFGDGNREVKLWGEAYFEVEAEEGRKFAVLLETGTVEVAGTSFNVSSYPGDAFTRTVLETGVVDFITPLGESTRLAAGESALFDIVRASVAVESVDVKYYTSWKDGVCLFRNAPMREIAATLGRLYDVEFEFADSQMELMRFSGAVLRDEPISHILELLEQTNSIRFSMSGDRKLTVNYN